MNKLTLQAAGAVLAILASTGIASAESPGQDTPGTIRARVEGAIVSGPPSVSAPTCDGATCVFGMESENSWAGGMAGVSHARAAVTLLQQSGVGDFVAFDLFVGTVEGCGAGSFVLRGHVSRPLADSGSGTLEVVEGSGSGDLTGMTGDGTLTVTPTGPTTATSEYSLSLKCRRHQDPSS